MDDRDLGGLLDLAYGAAVDASLWPGFLGAFADAMRADASALVWQDQRTRQGRGLGARLDPTALPLYFDAFATRHPSQRWQHDPRGRLRHFVPHIVADDDAMPKSELMRTDFYNHFMRPYDLHSVLRAGLAAQGEAAAFLMVARPQRRDRFEDEALATLARLHPHVIRAFELAQRLGGADPRQAGAEALLAGSAQAMLVVDATGHVLHANPAAEALIAAQIGVGLVAGRLAGPTSGETQRLQALIAQAGAPDVADRRGGSMALTSPQRRLPLPVSVAPVSADAPIALNPTPSVLVCISDLEAGASVSELRLRQVFDLSRAEARVAAAIFEGATPREAAEQLGVSFYTVRGHLVRIFEKTGAGRQAELMRLLAAVGGPWSEGAS